MAKNERQHGSYVMYKRGGCRCDVCTEANRRYQRRNSKMRAVGRSTLVDAAPVRAYVESLIRGGMTPRQIEDACGVHRTAIRVLLGTFPNRARSKRVRPATAQALMSVKPTGLAQPIKSAMVDATGTRRRLQALLAAGYTSRDLAARLGNSADAAGLQIARRPLVRADTARAVAALYDSLEHAPGPSSRAAAYYRALGYLTPAWWDPDTIDQPSAQPDGTRIYVDRTPKQRRQRAARSEPTLVDDVTEPRAARVARMFQLGYTPGEISERTGIPVRYVRRDLLRDKAS